MQIDTRKEKINCGTLAQEINTRYNQSVRHAIEAQNAGNSAVVAAVETGKLLVRAKQIVGHGNWLKWLADECPKISHDTARRWMTIASDSAVLRNLESLKTLTDAYQAVGILPYPDAKPEKPIGTHDVVIADQFAKGFAKRVESIRAFIQDVEWASMPMANAMRDEVRALAVEMGVSMDMGSHLHDARSVSV